MACSCKNKRKPKFVWTDANGENPVVYSSEIEAKAKTTRKGGSYEPIDS